MRCSPLLYVAHICAFSIIASGVVVAQTYAPPIVTKSFDPNPITEGNVGRLTITLTNPNSTDLSVSVKDVFPACMALANPYDDLYTGGCSSAVSPGDPLASPPVPSYIIVRSLGIPLAAGKSCTASFKVVPLDFPCDNTTDAPTLTYDAQNGPGTPANATWTDNAVTTLTYTGSNSGNLADSGNLGGVAAMDGDSVAFPAGPSRTTVVVNTPVNFQQFLITGNNYAFNIGAPATSLNLAAGIVFNFPAGTAQFNPPWTMSEDANIEAYAGRVYYGGLINTNGFTLGTFGAGGVTLNGGLSGSGTVGVGTAGGAAGSVFVVGTIGPMVAFDVVRGTLNTFSVFTGPVRIHGFGQFQAEGGPYGDITVSNHGSVYPVGSEPATLMANTMTFTNGTWIVGVASTPGLNSKIQTTGMISLSGTAVQLNLPGMPTVGDTYLIGSSAAGVSGCPADTYCNMAGCLARAVCTSTTVSEEIVDTEDLFHGPFETCPPSSASCQYQCPATGACEQ